MAHCRKVVATFIVLGLAAVLTACSSARRAAEPTVLPVALVGTEWVLTSLNGRAPLEGTHVTLAFEDASVSGFAGCNAYGAEQDNSAHTARHDGTLTIPPIAITAQLCPSPTGVMEQEKAYVEALGNAAIYRVVDERLEIDDAAGTTTLVFEAKDRTALDPAQLPGTAWRLTSINGAQPAEGSAPTLVFRDRQRYSGDAGCRGYVGAYNADGDGIRLPWLAMIGSAGSCSESLIAQEGAYTTALEWARDYVVVEGQLEIRTARGEVLTYEPFTPETDRDLEGSRWRLLAMLEDRTVEGMELALPTPVDRLPGSEVTAEYREGTMSGSAGCNAYSAAYTSQDLCLRIGPIVRTQMSCESPPGVMEQEQRYLDYLVNVTRYDIAGDQLWLETDDKRALVYVTERAGYKLADLIADLLAAGFNVEVAGGPVDHGFAIEGARIEVDSAAIYGYEFTDAATAETAASGVTTDERSITVTRSEGERTVVTHGDWAEKPHVYRKGRLIVIAGDHPRVLGALEAALGPPFAAGGPPAPEGTPKPACETYKAAVTLSASDTTLQVGDVLTITATLTNQGCGSLGMPQYRLYVESDDPQTLFDPATPEPVVHYLAIGPEQSDTIAFSLRAVRPGAATLRAWASFEFHMGYPGPAYWAGSSSGPVPVAVTEP